MELFKISTVGEFFGLLLLIIAIWFALTTFYLWLWKVIAVGIFGLPQLSFWQYVGFELLIRSLTAHNDIGQFKIKERED